MLIEATRRLLETVERFLELANVACRNITALGRMNVDRLLELAV